MKIKTILARVYKESYSSSSSTRGKKRLEILHGYIKEEIENKIPETHVVYSESENSDSKEYNFEGALNNKKLDISVVEEATDSETESLISAIAVKFVFSNYKQNAVNYFEQMVAETLNVKVSGKKMYQLIILRTVFPHFSSGKKKILNLEKIANEEIISRYKKYLEFEHQSENLVDGICLLLVNFNDSDTLETHMNLGENFNFKIMAEELINKLDEKKITITYPLKEAAINNAIDLNELLEFVSKV